MAARVPPSKTGTVTPASMVAPKPFGRRYIPNRRNPRDAQGSVIVGTGAGEEEFWEKLSLCGANIGEACLLSRICRQDIRAPSKRDGNDFLGRTGQFQRQSSIRNIGDLDLRQRRNSDGIDQGQVSVLRRPR